MEHGKYPQGGTMSRDRHSQRDLYLDAVVVVVHFGRNNEFARSIKAPLALDACNVVITQRRSVHLMWCAGMEKRQFGVT